MFKNKVNKSTKNAERRYLEIIFDKFFTIYSVSFYKFVSKAPDRQEPDGM